MGIMIETSEQTYKIVNSNCGNIAKHHEITIYSNKKGKICELDLFYSIGNNQINCPLSDIRTEKTMYSEDEFEVSEVTTFKDIDNYDVLICVNANIYKKPHKGWNYRLQSNVKFLILNDGRALHECHNVS